MAAELSALRALREEEEEEDVAGAGEKNLDAAGLCSTQC
jgi:hypothetical protein